MILLLARHGETDDNLAERFQGQRDPPLNDRGRAQAVALADTVRTESIAVLWASPLNRALETARVVGGTLGLEPSLDDRLMEVDVGRWAGWTYAEARAASPTAFAAWLAAERTFRFPGGESLDEHAARVRAALDDIRAAGVSPALVVCHGGVIRAARRAVAGDTGWAETVANGSVHRL